jgi:Zinc finger C-x8-C-x5-C-x3-H type (and similar)/Zinc-finger double-stranded RNA-binding
MYLNGFIYRSIFEEIVRVTIRRSIPDIVHVMYVLQPAETIKRTRRVRVMTTPNQPNSNHHPSQASPEQQLAWQNYYGYHQQLYSYPVGTATTTNVTATSSYTNVTSTSLHKPVTKRPRIDEFYCDACQMAVESSAAYDAHLRSHVPCSECSFRGSPRVVQAHYAKLHGKFRGRGFKTITVAVPGCRVQSFRICVGNHPEDVRQWIADRRKKFPRQNKGEPHSTIENQTMSQNAIATGHNIKEKKQVEVSSSHLNGLLDGYGSSSDDSTVHEDIKSSIELVTHASVSTTHNSKTEPPTDATTESTAKMSQPLHIPKSATPRLIPCRYFSQTGSCRRGSNCGFEHVSPTGVDDPFSVGHDTNTKLQIPTTTTSIRNISNNNNSNSTRVSMGKKKHTASSTLLKKLLKSDMDRETALTLQLLRHIVQCNFFQDTSQDLPLE